MIPDYLITPVVGAVIGYFTNWLAIKMIFRPYTEKRIFNIRVPFTPGLMPKERYVLSKKIGQVISEHLLTEEVMAKALISDDIHNNIYSLVDKAITSLKNNTNTIKDIQTNLIDTNSQFTENINYKITDIIINILQKDTLHDNVTDIIIKTLEKLLKQEAKDIPLTKFTSWLEKVFANYGDEYIKSDDFENLISDYFLKINKNLAENESTIGEFIPTEIIEKTKLLISDKVPTISKLILTLIQIPEVETKLKTLISNLINDNVSKLVMVFVSSDKVAESIITSLKEYLNNEENYSKTYDMITAYIDKISEMKINELTQKIPEDYKDYPIATIIMNMTRKTCTNENLSKFLNSMSSHITKLDNKNIYDIIVSIEPDIKNKLSAYIKEQLQKINADKNLHSYIYKTIGYQINLLMDTQIKDIMSKLTDEHLDFIKKTSIKIYDFIIQKTMINILEAMNISKVVEDRINDFEIKEAEDIVITVVKKELKAITLIGGVLGFVIGLVPILI